MDGGLVAQSDRFAGRVAVVTGGGSGVGAAVARRLAAEGATVVIVGRTRERLDDVVRLVPAGSTVVARAADVGDEQAVTALVDGVADEYGRLDVLVHAASCRTTGRVEDLTTAAWHEALATDLDGVFLASRAALPHLRAVGGSIVTLAAAGPVPGSAAAAATQAGVVGLTEAMALDHRADGVRANAVRVTTAPEGEPPRGGARDDDVAAVVALLASDEAGSLTGAVVRVGA